MGLRTRKASEKNVGSWDNDTAVKPIMEQGKKESF